MHNDSFCQNMVLSTKDGLVIKTSPKGFSASKCDLWNWIFSNLFWEDFFGRKFLGVFFRRIFLGGIFWGRNFTGELLGRIFWEEFFVYMVKVI